MRMALKRGQFIVRSSFNMQGFLKRDEKEKVLRGETHSQETILKACIDSSKKSLTETKLNKSCISGTEN